MSLMRPIHWLLCVAATAVLVVRGEPIRILTTLPAIHSWAANVAGDSARVDNLLPADVGPHDFQFRPADIRKLAGADVVFVNGLGVDGWLDRAIASGATKPGRRVVTVTDGLKSSLIHEVPELEVGAGPANATEVRHGESAHGHGSAEALPNPHVWLDPVQARHCVSNILATLVAADPANADGYSRRATAYLKELEALDTEIHAAVGRFSDRRIVTFHDAFPYFCRRYGLELVGVIEEVPSVDPSPKYLASLLSAMRRNNVRVIFTEPQFNARLARRLAEDLKITVAELDVLETGRPSRTFYADGMRRNLKSLEAALR